MKKASTLIRPGNWKSVFLVLFAWCLVGGINAQITLDLSNDNRANDTECDHAGSTLGTGVYTDPAGSGGTGLYNDFLTDSDQFNGEFFWTFCPDSPMDSRVRITFSEFDIAQGDGFRIYSGTCENAQASVAAGNAATDAFNTFAFGTAGILIEGNSVGSQTFRNPTFNQFGGSSPTGTPTPQEVGVNFGRGWVEADCDNLSGCLTVGWFTNEDNQKGTGWEFEVTEVDRDIAIGCPGDFNQDGDFSDGGEFDFYSNVTAACGGDAVVFLAFPTFNGCLANGFFNSSVYQIEVLVDGLSAGFLPLANHPDFGFPAAELGVGSHTIEYVVFYDSDGDGDPFDGNLMEKTRRECSFIVLDNADLVCNDNVNISLGEDCSTNLEPDDIIESQFTPAYPLTIEIGGGTFTANFSNDNFRNSGGTMLRLEAGTHSYVLRDDCGNACTGSISLADLQGPTCPGNTVNYLLCGTAPDAEAPNFIDCNDIIDTSFDDAVIGSCGLFTTDERDALLALTPSVGEITWYTQNEILDANGNGTGIFRLPSTLGSPDFVESVTVRSWKAEDAVGNISEGCLQIFVNVRPSMLTGPNQPIITVACGTNTDPTDLIGVDDINGDALGGADVVPQFSVDIPGAFSPLTGSGAVLIGQTGFVLPEDHSVCGWITSFTDQEVEACGNSRKIIRSWTWLDWCAETPTIFPTTGPFTQVIEVVDNEEPALVGGPDPMTRFVGHFECLADITVGSAVWTDNCGEIASVRTELLSLDSDGDPDQVLWRNNENGGSFQNIPVGDYALRYYATDECGNETSELGDRLDSDWNPIPANVFTVSLSVFDDVRPQPQCDDRINISLGSDWGRIDVAAVDEGSFDNCGIASMGISLSESGPFEESVQVQCEDVHELLQVFLQVEDESGNTNTCWGNVVIEDKIPPVCEAPADMTVSCDIAHFVDIPDGEVTGDVAADLNATFGSPNCVDNLECVDLGIVQTIKVDRSDCGEFTVERVFTATDWNRTSEPVTQIITVVYNADWKLTFPEDATVGCAEAGNGAFGSAASAEDILTSVGLCDRLSVNVEEQVFNGSTDACVKIVRTYTVWNSCGTPGVVFNANEAGVTMVQDEDTNAQQIVYTQTISADITEGPSISFGSVDNTIFGSATKDGNTVCSETKSITFWAEDCLDFSIAPSNITYTLTGSSGVILEGTGADIAFSDADDTYTIEFDASVGDFTLEVWASDGCGNSNGATQSYTFVDAKAPSIWLFTTLSTAIMPSNGMIDIWAGDFISEVVDCDLEATGIWHESLGAAPTTPAGVRDLDQNVVFSCDHVGTQIVRIYAIDQAGNFDFVETALVIQDQSLSCVTGEIDVDEEQTVAGKIINPDGEFVETVNVSVNGGMTNAMTTGNAGTYGFTVPTGGDYTITPQKDINHLNGVSTFDLVLISKHILNIDNFTSPYEFIAADINRSGTITAFDMVQLRQLILNINTEFTNNTSWRFVDASHNFGPLATTLSQNFPEIANINNIASDQLEVNFIAVKIGDVNGSALASSLVTAEARNANGTLVLTTEDRSVAKGEQVSVSFTAANMASVEGYQFTMNYAGLELNQVVEGVAKAANFNNVRGALATSWNGKATATDVLFTTDFTATADGLLSELISVSSDVTTAEAYSTAGELLDVAIEFTATPAANFDLMQNTPNPFNAETVIGFNLPTAGSATLKIMDIQGKVLKNITADYAKGYNQISLNAKELGATGVLSYQLESASNVVTKKMIIID